VAKKPHKKSEAKQTAQEPAYNQQQLTKKSGGTAEPKTKAINKK